MPNADWWFYLVMSIVATGFGWLGGYLRHQKTRAHVTDEMESFGNILLDQLSTLTPGTEDVAILQARNNLHRQFSIIFFKELPKEEQDKALDAISTASMEFSTRLAGKGPNAISDEAERKKDRNTS